MKMGETILFARNLTTIYKKGNKSLTAVNRVNLDIKKGEFISLVGESGCGKTTLADTILQLRKPSSGELLFNGEKIVNKKRFWLECQAIFQDPFTAFNLYSTIKEILLDCFHIMDLFNESEAEFYEDEKINVIKESLKAVGLDDVGILEKYPYELSGGELQRILIARIYIIKPTMLIADEPTSMIDASSRAVIIDLLKSLKKEYSITILFITHDIGLAYNMSDKIFVMNSGQIVETGTAKEVIYTPTHPYTKRLIQDVPLLSSSWI